MEVITKKTNLNVLIIDDDPEICSLLAAYLNRSMIAKSIVMAHDGMSAAAKLRNQKFDLILLDMRMPKKNGYELLSEIKNDKLHSVKSILAISGEMDKDIFTIVTFLGVKNILIKPFNENLFMEKISKLLSAA